MVKVSDKAKGTSCRELFPEKSFILPKAAYRTDGIIEVRDCLFLASENRPLIVEGQVG